MKFSLIFIKILCIALFSLIFSEKISLGEASNGQSFVLSGSGFGKTEDEAKIAALDDLASVIKVRVYSKYSLSIHASEKSAYGDSTRFIKIISDVPLLNPEIEYFKENGNIKAVASLTNIEAYTVRLNEIASKIDAMIEQSEKTLVGASRFALLEKVLPLYDEFDRYALVPMIVGFGRYNKPKITGAEALEKYLAMSEIPPDLNVAADILTKDLKGRRNIFVPPPLTSRGEATEFSVFFAKILSSKINSSIEERSDYRFQCVYAETGRVLLTSCSLISGGTIVSSSAVKIPLGLLSKINYKPKAKAAEDFALSGTSKGNLKASVMIRPENSGMFLRDGDYFTILVRLNKPAYVYTAAFPAKDSMGYPGVCSIGGDAGFVKYISSEGSGNWVSLGRFRAGYPLGASVIYLFALSDKPDNVSSLIPVYLRDKLYEEGKDNEEVAKDLTDIFNLLEGEKTLSVIKLPGLGK